MIGWYTRSVEEFCRSLRGAPDNDPYFEDCTGDQASTLVDRCPFIEGVMSLISVSRVLPVLINNESSQYDYYLLFHIKVLRSNLSYYGNASILGQVVHLAWHGGLD